MVDKIVFRGSKALAVSWVPEKQKHVEKEINTLIQFLQCYVEIESGTKFRDLWKFIVCDQKILQLVFMTALGGHPLNLYIKEANKPPKDEPKDPDDSIQFLKFSWGNEYHEDYDEPKGSGKLEFYLYPDFHGWGKYREKHAVGGEKIEETSYGIDLTPINELMDFELKIDDKLVVRDIFVRGSVQPPKNILTAKLTFSLYDILYAVLNEISFYGSPEKRESTLKVLQGRVKKVDEDIANNVTKGYTTSTFNKKTGKLIFKPLKSWKKSKKEISGKKPKVKHGGMM